MITAIASGKGGTGKTFLSVSLASAWKGDITLFDCDVEEPDAALFLKTQSETEVDINSEHPCLSPAQCSGCGRCASVCRFNAIMQANKNKPVFFPELCHSCGACITLCPSKAIGKLVSITGSLTKGRINGIKLLTGKLKTGNPLAAPLIKKVLKNLDRSEETIIDCPPGTSCPFSASVTQADYVIIVTEETPFGLHDAILAAEVLRLLSKPFGLVINKSENRIFHEMDEFIRSEKIEMLGRIPWSMDIAKTLSRGEIPGDEYSEQFREIHLKAREDFQRKRAETL